MRISRVLLITILIVSLSGCSFFRGGKGSGRGAGEGNIPLAEGEGVLKDVHFAFDSSALSQEAQSKLNQNASWLKENSDVSIVIEGHCDERGTAEYNLALGERRASSVKDYMRTLGVDSGRMETISYGEELPLDPRSNEEAWSKNRRAHFAIKE